MKNIFANIFKRKSITNPQVEQIESSEKKEIVDEKEPMETEPAYIRSTYNDLYADDDSLTHNNKLKNDSKGVVVILPKQEEKEHIAFNLTEKEFEPESVDDLTEDELDDLNNMQLNVEDEEEIEEITEPVVKKTVNINSVKKPELKIQFDDEVDMELEIQERFEDEEEVVVPSKKVQPGELYDPMLELSNYKYPSTDLLEAHGSEKIVQDPNELEANKNQIIATLKNYDIAIQRIAATVGPSITLYEITPAIEVRISRIKNLEEDIEFSLAALGVRIIAPMPGKGTIGIEIPNACKALVTLKSLLISENFQNSQFSLPLAIGKQINDNYIIDLAIAPHLLIAGDEGQGKTISINALILSLLYKKHPAQLKFVMIDPKKVELSLYRVIEKHFLAKLPGEDEPIITDTKKVVHTLNALCTLMDIRYDLLKEAGCLNIKEYNEKFIQRRLNPNKGHEYMPFLVLVINEFNDLLNDADKEIESTITRIISLGPKIGIHSIISTNLSSSKSFNKNIKKQFASRIVFKLFAKNENNLVLNNGRADKLSGDGDLLIEHTGQINRLQSAYVSSYEIENVCQFIGNQHGYPEAFKLPEYVDEKDMEGKAVGLADKDPLFEDAARLVVQNQLGSPSLIQRRMKLGYNRAGRLMDQLEIAGIVGPNLGSKAREVICKTDGELQEILDTL